MVDELKGKYLEAIGRRKTATARVRLFPSVKSSILVNDLDFSQYFKIEEERRVVEESFTKSKTAVKFRVVARVRGGGSMGQAAAIRHGIARALVADEPELRKKLKKAGLLKRDPRMKERRKFGLKKARKAPQWSKR
jgi:small subunit ribosomal protein S9